VRGEEEQYGTLNLVRLGKVESGTKPGEKKNERESARAFAQKKMGGGRSGEEIRGGQEKKG